MSILRHLPYAVLSAGLLAAGSASAQSMWSIDRREDMQQERIDQGRRNGTLTPGEYHRLDRAQDRIDDYERRARADGVVSRHERQRLDGMLDRQGRAIYRETHDNQRADRRGWGDRDGWRHSGWGHDDGRRDGWGHDHGRRDGGGHNDWRRDGRDHDHGRRDGWNNGRHEGWARGEHNGRDGNRPPGIERRDARAEHRIDNGRRDGSLSHGETHRLQNHQNRIDRYQGPGSQTKCNTLLERCCHGNSLQSTHARRTVRYCHATSSGQVDPANRCSSGSRAIEHLSRTEAQWVQAGCW